MSYVPVFFLLNEFYISSPEPLYRLHLGVWRVCFSYNWNTSSGRVFFFNGDRHPRLPAPDFHRTRRMLTTPPQPCPVLLTFHRRNIIYTASKHNWADLVHGLTFPYWDNRHPEHHCGHPKSFPPPHIVFHLHLYYILC